MIQGPRRQASRFATKGLAFRMGRRPFSCVPLKHRQEFDRHACSRRHQQLHTQPHMQPHMQPHATLVFHVKHKPLSRATEKPQRHNGNHNVTERGTIFGATTSQSQQSRQYGSKHHKPISASLPPYAIKKLSLTRIKMGEQRLLRLPVILRDQQLSDIDMLLPGNHILPGSSI